MFRSVHPFVCFFVRRRDQIRENKFHLQGGGVLQTQVSVYLSTESFIILSPKCEAKNKAFQLCLCHSVYFVSLIKFGGIRF